MKRLIKHHLIFQEKSATFQQAVKQTEDLHKGDEIKGSNLVFYGPASGVDEIVDYVYNDITTELWSCQKYLEPIKSKVESFIKDKNFQTKNYNVLISGYQNNSRFSSNSELGLYIIRNNIDFLSLCDISQTKTNIKEDMNVYILNECYVYMLFSFSYYLKQGGKVITVNDDNYKRLCEEDQDFNQAFNTLFANEVLDYEDDIGDESILTQEIDYDTRDNCFVYINNELRLGDGANDTHSSVIEKFMKEKNCDYSYDDAYGRPSQNDLEEYIPINSLGFGHISNNVAFIETDTLSSESLVDDIINKLRGKVQKIYTYPDEINIKRVANDKAYLRGVEYATWKY